MAFVSTIRTRVRCRVIAGFFGGFAAVAIQAAPASATWLPSPEIWFDGPADPAARAEPQLAFDKKGNTLVVWSDVDGANHRIRIYLRPYDNGFQQTDTLSSSQDLVRDWQVAFDQKGNALVVWRGLFTAPSYHSEIRSNFRPRNGSFEGPETIKDGSYGENPASPQVEFDPRGGGVSPVARGPLSHVVPIWRSIPAKILSRSTRLSFTTASRRLASRQAA